MTQNLASLGAAPTHNAMREMSREEKKIAKMERKRQHAAAQAAVVRVVNLADDYPHIVMRQSVWYIVNPRNGTQFVKHRRMVPTVKLVRDQHGTVINTIRKVHASTELAMKGVDAAGRPVLIHQKIVKVDVEGNPIPKAQLEEDPGAGFDLLTWPVPKGVTPVVEKNSNYCDLPPDAANLIFNGEYRGPHPLTMQRDLRYHNGDLVPLSAAHDLADGIYRGKSAEMEAAEAKKIALAAENAVLEKALAEKRKELESLGVLELLEKKKVAAKGSSTTPDSPSKPGA